MICILATFTSLQTSNHVGENVKKVNQRAITAVYWELQNYKLSFTCKEQHYPNTWYSFTPSTSCQQVDTRENRKDNPEIEATLDT